MWWFPKKGFGVMAEIILASSNEGKVNEFREMTSEFPVQLTSLKDHWQPLPDIEETGDTFYENAKIKADWVFEHSGGVWALADDSGLEVDALGGAPGVHSARFAGESKSSEDNNRKLLELLSDVADNLRTARFRCVLVLKTGPNSYIEAQGVCEGTILHSPRGGGGFGYDPLFVPEGGTASFAEIDSSVKHRVSHRGKAMKQLSEIISSLFGQ